MKKAIRKELLQKRLSLKEDYIEASSQIIYEKIIAHPDYKNSESIMSYMDFRNEVQTKKINEKILKDGKKLILPLTDMKAKKLYLYLVKDLKKDLELSNYGILEPKKSNSEVTIENIDLILVPGVAFNSDNYRMGYGGGFYDRLLSEYKKKMLGLFFEAQKSDKLIVEDHDRQIVTIITEENDYILQGK